MTPYRHIVNWSFYTLSDLVQHLELLHSFPFMAENVMQLEMELMVVLVYQVFNIFPLPNELAKEDLK